MTGPRNAAIAAEIRAELGRQELSRRELAKMIGKPDTTVARWLRSATAMDPDEIDAIAVALNMTALELLARAYNAPLTGPGKAVSSGWRSRRHIVRLIRPGCISADAAA